MSTRQDELEEDWAQMLRALRERSKKTVTEVANGAGVAPSTVLRAETGRSEPSIALYSRMVRAIGARLLISEPEESDERNKEPCPPNAYPNPRDDNAWDNDAVHWLLEQPGVRAEGWKRGPLMESLRRQPSWLRNQPDRVEAAAQCARANGVIQREVFDTRRGKTIVRLYRTDPGRPKYPGSPPPKAR